MFMLAFYVYLKFTYKLNTHKGWFVITYPIAMLLNLPFFVFFSYSSMKVKFLIQDYKHFQKDIGWGNYVFYVNELNTKDWAFYSFYGCWKSITIKSLIMCCITTFIAK